MLNHLLHRSRYAFIRLHFLCSICVLETRVNIEIKQLFNLEMYLQNWFGSTVLGNSIYMQS